MATASSGGSAGRNTPISDSRLDRVLASMIVGIIVLSVVSIIVYMVGTANAWDPTITYSFWAIFFFGLPIAVILMVVVTIRISIRRRRENAQG
jgi:cytochrome c-type biogenesis protein CcmH/NrfF